MQELPGVAECVNFQPDLSCAPPSLIEHAKQLLLLSPSASRKSSGSRQQHKQARPEAAGVGKLPSLLLHSVWLCETKCSLLHLCEHRCYTIFRLRRVTALCYLPVFAPQRYCVHVLCMLSRSCSRSIILSMPESCHYTMCVAVADLVFCCCLHSSRNRGGS